MITLAKFRAVTTGRSDDSIDDASVSDATVRDDGNVTSASNTPLELAPRARGPGGQLLCPPPHRILMDFGKSKSIFIGFLIVVQGNDWFRSLSIKTIERFGSISSRGQIYRLINGSIYYHKTFYVP